MRKESSNKLSKKDSAKKWRQRQDFHSPKMNALKETQIFEETINTTFQTSTAYYGFQSRMLVFH
ncbi:hypothetical protein [Flammeovirga sp. EKP202]|uniref:hypothetical protein n=1 Tax=Flammeovirga sp. EKP202 TaxID=2770592 RepID=UPI00165FEF92|nr:hypothetical protein [Flammeovirga sp. EKP202]MBD0403219.1 hypothetical protein [Flammeovirga sp. EKP202]